ncbi:fungal-specific transcription factor domain-containing protein [Xylogone sp. PMI_703]|nr:fungal-specific transcription factor domain-containing protein [Xylogone sp. PMI_703]
MKMSPRSDKAAAPIRKRLRVPVSCSHCRRRKIKCDGKRPCNNCALRDDSKLLLHFYNNLGCINFTGGCIYATASGGNDSRERGSEQNQQELRNRVDRLESLLKLLISPAEETGTPSNQAVPQRAPNPQLNETSTLNQEGCAATQSGNTDENDPMPLIERMLEAAEIDDQGNWSYQGYTSGQYFLRSMRQQLGPFINDEAGKDIKVLNLPIRRAIDASIDQGWRTAVALPPRALAEELVSLAVYDACGIMIFVHAPSFFDMIHRIYSVPADSYSSKERAFLPALYAAIAVGFVFKNDPIGSPAKDKAFQDGTRYFITSRQLVDLANCRTLYSLQTLVFMFLFYQCTGQMMKSYSIISIALTSALQMGLHRNLPIKTDLIESEARKRTFWVIRKLEAYVGSMLGLPNRLSSDDIDQELPADAEDHHITEQAIYPMATDSKVYPMLAANAHTRMFMIFTKILEVIQPVQSIHTSARRERLVLSSKNVVILEQQLEEWKETLPQSLRAGPHDASPTIQRMQYYLHIGFSYIRFNLYRPFLYYLSPEQQSGLYSKCYEYGYTCITISRNVISVADIMYNRKLLDGEAWFPCHATFSAIMALSYFILRNKDHLQIKDITRDALLGHQILESLSRHSLWADRCLETLKPVIERLTSLAGSFDNEAATGDTKYWPSPAVDMQINQQAGKTADKDSLVVGKEMPNAFSQISDQHSSSSNMSNTVCGSVQQLQANQLASENSISIPETASVALLDSVVSVTDPDYTVLNDLKAWAYPEQYFGFDDMESSMNNSLNDWPMGMSSDASAFITHLQNPLFVDFVTNPNIDMESVEPEHREK